MAKQQLDIGFFSAVYSQVNGHANAVRFLSEAIAKLGHNVHVFAPGIQDGYKKPKTLYFHELGGVPMEVNKITWIASMPVHKMFFCQEDYLDITHMHTHAAIGSMAINWAKYLGIPMVGTHNSPMAYYSAQYFPIIGKLLTKSDLIWRYERHILDKYDIVHVPTKSKKELLREYRFKEPMVCFTNGIHDIFYSNVRENGIREKYNLEGKKVLLYAARLSTEKHPVSIVKNFKKIHKEVPDAHLMLVGNDGNSMDHVKRLVKKREYRDFVTYAGRVSFADLLKLYNTADLTALWSWVEAEGLVLLEAMAQGTPNVGANACGISNIIRHGETGYLANDFDQFNDYVIKLMKDDDLRAEFGKKAKEIAQQYRVTEIAKTWIKIYKFTINELYPLRYYRKERKARIELVKEFVKTLPNVTF